MEGNGEQAVLLPDETAFDVIRAVRCCRGTGITCIDGHLDDGCLGPSELLVLHGKSGSAKSTLIRNIIASYISATETGGHGLPAVLIDADGTFDVLLLARLLSAIAERTQSEEQCEISTGEFVQEALSRLLVLRPAEPLDLLRHLCLLRDVVAANPTTSLLVVDSMSAWQSMASAFPRAVMPVLSEAWKAIERLQREHCLAVVVTLLDAAIDSGRFARNFQGCAPSQGLTCRHLDIGPCVTGHDGISPSFVVSNRLSIARLPVAPKTLQNLKFFISEAGEVISVAA